MKLHRLPLMTLGVFLVSVVLVGVILIGAPVAAQTRSLAIPKTPSTTSGDPGVNVDNPRRLPRQLQGLGFEPKLGDQLPIDLEFLDQRGNPVKLSTLIDGDRPVLLAPVYYDCPMLCSMVLDGVVRGIKPLEFLPGREFDVIAVSFDPRETPVQAATALDTVLARYRKPETAPGWNFLVAEPGNERAVVELMDAIGFRYRWDEETKLFAHAGGVVVLTPEGRVSRYFSGVDFAPKDLRLSFLEASGGGIGTWADQVLLFCYQYDPDLGKYSAATMRIVRVAGVLTALLLGGYLLLNWRRDRRETAAARTIVTTTTGATP